MSTLHYHLRIKPGYKLADEERVRLSINKVRKLLVETEVNSTVVGFFHGHGVTSLCGCSLKPYKLYEMLVEAKGRVGTTCPKLHHTTVGP